MEIKKTKIGGIEIRRTYRPARIICDVITLAGIVVIMKISSGLLSVWKFLGFSGTLAYLLPAVAVGMCAVYVILTFKSLKFKRYKITKQNAQDVYNWWAFSLALVKLPLLLILIEGDLMFWEWAYTGEKQFSVLIVLYAVMAVIIMRLAAHRIRSLTDTKKVESDDSAVKVKVKIADNDDKEN